MIMFDKEKFMKRAIFLAQRGRGLTAPNPCVGSVVVRDGRIIGEGWHKGYGLDHAEVDSIKDAINKGNDVKGAEIYVTLEPCNHYGKTPPCTEFILKHGIKKVFIGCNDPNPEVAGGGAEFLRKNGVEVEQGVLEKECRELIEDFLIWIEEKRPFVFLKLASTLDGKIADRFGNSSWISNEKSRKFVHKLRAMVDVVLVGGNTFYKDNPKLTSRLKNVKKQPLAAIVSKKFPPLSEETFFLLKERIKETVFFTKRQDLKKFNCLKKQGLKFHFISETENALSLREILGILYKEYSCYYLLCEGGGKIACSLLEEGLVDELVLFFAPKVIGDNAAVPSFYGREGVVLKDSFDFDLKKVKTFDDDVCVILKPKRT